MGSTSTALAISSRQILVGIGIQSARLANSSNPNLAAAASEARKPISNPTWSQQLRDNAEAGLSFTELLLRKAHVAVDTNPAKIVFGIINIALELKAVSKPTDLQASTEHGNREGRITWMPLNAEWLRP